MIELLVLILLVCVLTGCSVGDAIGGVFAFFLLALMAGLLGLMVFSFIV